MLLILSYSSASLSNNEVITNHKSNNIEYRLVKLLYNNSSGEKGVTIFEYNENGIMHKAIWKFNDGSKSSVNLYEYNDCGNLIYKYREFSDSITSEIIYEYDDDCNLIQETYKNSEGLKGITKYEYNENDLIQKANCEALNGWFYGIIIYSYDSDGLKTKANITQNRVNTGTITYTYDDLGNLVVECWNFNGKWNQTFLFEYEKVENVNK